MKRLWNLAFVAALLTATPVLSDQTLKDPIPEVLISDLMQDLQLQEFHAAAIAGNLAQETGNFTILHQIGGSGIGWSQWTGERRAAYRRFAGSDGNALKYDINYAFLISELTGPYSETLQRLRQTRTVEEATALFMKEFLRPSARHAALSKRIAHASNYLDGDFSGAGCKVSLHIGQGRLAECEKISWVSKSWRG